VVSINFTENTSAIVDFMNAVKTLRGNDVCEDVFGGLEEVIGLGWTNPNRILIHVGDSSQHGTRYFYTLLAVKLVPL
jgi:hypothetical protein